jgi:hypothetical protein
MEGKKFTDDDICRSDIPRDAFLLLHDLAYDHEGRDRWQYRRRAQEILSNNQQPTEALFDLGEKKKPDEEVILHIWEYYKKKINKTFSVFDDKRKQMALARFRECVKVAKGDRKKAQEWMEIAIDELSLSDFHNARGQYKGKPTYNNFEHVFRSWTKLETFLNRSNEQ